MADPCDSRNVFITFSSKITQLSYDHTKNDRDLINESVDGLNRLNYKYPIVTNHTKAVLLINYCCTLVLPEDVELVRKCCHLITNLVTMQKITISGRTLTVATLWCLQALKHESRDVDVLIALDALLRNTNHDLIVEITRNEKIMSLARDSESPEVVFHALQCLEACTIPSEDAKPLEPSEFSQEYQQCFIIFLNHIQHFSCCSDLLSGKIQVVCLRGLQNVIRQHPEFLTDNLGIVLGVIKSYSTVGIDGIDFTPPQKLMPSSLSIPEKTTTTREKGGKMTRQRKPKTQPVVMKTKKIEDWDDVVTSVIHEDDVDGSLKTSDSDFSDTEGGNIAKLVAMKGRVRRAALTLFLYTIKLTDRAVMFSFWTSFVPENPAAGKHNLTTCILKETSNKGRMIALNALLLLLSSSKLYLTQAEKSESKSFTPFSVVLGFTIHELHKCLSLALTERSVPVLNMVLKCFASLVQATPYHRLAPGLVTKTIRNVKPLVFHKDATVQVTALVVLGCILASEPPLPETRSALLKNDTNWLVERCLALLEANDSVVTPVKLESLQILSVMSRNHFDSLLAPHFDTLVHILDSVLGDKHADVQLHAARTVEFVGQAVTRCDVPIERCLLLWTTLLDGSLDSLLHCDKPLLRAAACDCLGTIGAVTFDQLPRDKQLLCVTLLFACSRDDDNGVKGAAVRALGIFVTQPGLREDDGFVVDAAETICRLLDDENFAVRVKCSWALGNLSDTTHALEEFPKSLFFKLLKATIKASKDGDKIKVNTVRALGNFLRLVRFDWLDEERFKDATLEAMDVFITICTSSTNMKVKWNCCYAIGNAMKNSALFALGSTWPEQIFTIMSQLVVNFRNFKVRINAAGVLAAPQKREFYKNSFHNVWISLVKGLETSQNVEDLDEYKHRDNLVEQICLGLGHLSTLLTKDDLLSLTDIVQCDHFKVQMVRVWDKLLPEKASVLCDARQYITDLQKTKDLNAEQKIVLRHLADALHHEF